MVLRIAVWIFAEFLFCRSDIQQIILNLKRKTDAFSYFFPHGNIAFMPGYDRRAYHRQRQQHAGFIIMDFFQIFDM